jgi:hypothetical protein
LKTSQKVSIASGWTHFCVHATAAALSPDSTNQLSPADIISTVEFDHTGDYLATGDKGGRVVLFERNDAVSFAR